MTFLLVGLHSGNPRPRCQAKAPGLCQFPAKQGRGRCFWGRECPKTPQSHELSASWLGGVRLSPWGQHKCLVHMFGLRGNDTLSMGRGYGLSAFVSFPVMLGLLPIILARSAPTIASVNIAEFVLAGKRARHAPLPFRSRLLLIESISR